MPLGDLLPGALAHLPPVFRAARRDAVRPQDQPAHHLVFRGAVKIDDQELDADVGEEIHGDVVDEGLVEDGIQRALLDVRLLFGDALAAVVHVHFDVRVWGGEEGEGPTNKTAHRHGQPLLGDAQKIKLVYLFRKMYWCL